MKTYKGKTNEDYEIILEDEHLKFTITKSGVTKSGTYHYRDFYFKKKRTTFLFRSDLFHLDLILKGQSTIHISLPKIKNETEINEIFRYTNDRRGFYKRLDKESLIKVKQSSKKLRKKVERNKEVQRNQLVNKKILSVINEFDKDGNGILDVIEGNDDFMKLFRKHQSLIKEFDKNYINNLVKISNYLKIKSKNIQQTFVQIRKTKNQTELENYVGLLKNQIHTYESVFYHSLQLINSIVQDDFITVNEIYEEFDKLKMFKSDHEKEVSEKLSDIKDGLSDLMYSIDSMERNIVGGLNELTYITSDGFSVLNNSLGNELKSIQSTLGLNNLLTGIQTYQMYKINKNTKSLRS